MKCSHSILLAVLLSSCVTGSHTTQQRIEPQFDLHISTVNIGGFKLQMTPRAVLAVIKANGYRESSGNRVTVEDLIANPRMPYTVVEVFEFSHGESLDDRLLRETGIFNLMFQNGRVEEITYNFFNLTKEKLEQIRKQNAVTFDFVIERETKDLDVPRKGTAISWLYKPNKLAFLRINYFVREPRFAQPRLEDPGVGSCDYSITVFDANPNLPR